MTTARPIEIAGGGLAGLALGLALRRRDVPVTVWEAGEYPRHRVCGEFITGLDEATSERLGLDPLLAGAQPHREVAWFYRDRVFRRQQLPATAWAISRYVLDARLAEAFVAAGGRLCTRTRADLGDTRPGRINAAGRMRTPSPWLGLKVHVRGLTLERGLEMHLGRGAYTGLCQLPGGEVNVCGLFRRRAKLGAARAGVLPAYLRATGCDALADRLEAAKPIAGSETAVAGFEFGRVPDEAGLRLGDAHGMLPPFFGNGMAAAFQMADELTAPLAHWSRVGGDWVSLGAVMRQRLVRRFRRRATLGGILHQLVLSPFAQPWFAGLARWRCVPFRLLYAGLH